ncbi:MAG: hypothetical protein O3A13_10265 [Proteobacteria bacterium]|nr:hypothetical protein [Pseudomonadota bacterium]
MHLLIVIALSLLLTNSQAHEVANEAECREAKEKIRHLQSRMRSGYSRAQGERLESKLRKLQAKRKATCR